jgi:murein hydrolase activator
MLKKTLRNILVLLLLCSTVAVIAQRGKRVQPAKNVDRAELEQQRVALMQEIKETQAKLSELQKDKNATVQQLNALQQKLGAREALIGNINKEISYLEKNILIANKDAEDLGNNLEQLKKKYAELIRYSYKQRSAQNILLFLFSSNSFNDGLRRYKYVKQYRDYRKAQANKILATKNELNSTITMLNEQKMQKDAMRKSEEEQKLVIAQETEEKNSVVLNLKGQEAQLSAAIAAKQKTAQALNNAIATAIKREIELARRKAQEERIRLAKIKAEAERKQREAERQVALAKRKADEEERRRAREQAELNKRNKALATKKELELNKKETEAPKGKTIAARKTNVPEVAVNKKEPAPVAKPTPKAEPSNPRYVASNNDSKKAAEENKPTANSYKPIEVEDTKPTKQTSYAEDLTEDVRNLSANFELNKGNLSAPVNGYVSSHFGKNKHAVYNIMEENFGIDIRTAKGATAKAVFSGEVISVIYINGAGNNVVVSHGKYFTLYSKIDKVNVTVGQKISARSPIGTVLTDAEGNTQVHFEIWKVGANNVPTQVNPEPWLRF